MTRLTRGPAFAQALLALALLLVPVPGAGQELRVTSDVPVDQFIARDATVELQVSRTLDPATEGLAVLFGTMHVSRL